MNEGDIETLRLAISLDLLPDSEGEPTAEEEDDEDFVFEVEVLVQHLDPRHFRVAETTSLTFFGNCGPSFQLGDVIEAEALPDGTYRFLGTRVRGKVWAAWVPNLRPPGMGGFAARGPLERFLEAGGSWEWAGAP